MNNTIYYIMNAIPNDVFERYIYKNENCILLQDPKHNSEAFHYTIWYIKEHIKDIYSITPEVMKLLKEFIEEIKQLELFKNEKMYFTYPPNINSLHLHILPYDYISHRPSNELFLFEDIYNMYQL